MTKIDAITAEAAALFEARDQLEAELRRTDARLRELRASYMHEARVWGISIERFRHEAGAAKVAA